jgi:hypothetical protein
VHREPPLFPFGYNPKRVWRASFAKKVPAFSKCKSKHGRTVDEEQKMFTSQKYSMFAEQSLALVAAVFLKTSSIIANGSLMRGIAYAAAISAMVGAAP